MTTFTSKCFRTVRFYVLTLVTMKISVCWVSEALQFDGYLPSKPHSVTFKRRAAFVLKYVYCAAVILFCDVQSAVHNCG
jgi:hypothetical protein